MASVLAALRKSAQKSGTIYPIDSRGGWSPFIREPYAGAWQNNDPWVIDCVLAYPIVYACISLISSDIAKLPPYLCRETESEIWVKVKNKRIDALLAKPNHYQNHIQFKEWWITSKLIRGNTYILKSRNSDGSIRALYVLDPNRVMPLVAPNGEVFYQLGQDWLNGCDQSSVTVPASEIIHDRMNCLFHPLVGISPLFASGLAANQGLKIQKDMEKFFANGANPSGILTAPGEISQETADRLKIHWDTHYTGKNAGKVAVLGDGLTFEPMRMTSVDAQVTELLNWSDLSICATFHVPPYKVNAGPPPAAASVDALTVDYYTQCLQILIESMELCLDEGMEFTDGTGVELDLDVLFRMDRTTLVKMLGEAQKSGITAPDESRKRMNLPPVEGGNTPYLQQQNFSLAALAKRDAKEDPFATSSKEALPPSTAPAVDGIPADTGKSFSLDGAQTAALRGIITAAMAGEILASTAKWMIVASFPGIPSDTVDKMVENISITPSTKNVEDENVAGDMLLLLPLFLREELRCES